MGRRAKEVEEDTEDCYYLGFRLVMSIRDIMIFDSGGRELGTVKSMESARGFIRAYRKEQG